MTSPRGRWIVLVWISVKWWIEEFLGSEFSYHKDQILRVWMSWKWPNSGNSRDIFNSKRCKFVKWKQLSGSGYELIINRTILREDGRSDWS